MSNPSTGEGRHPGPAGVGCRPSPAETGGDWARGVAGHDSGRNRGRLGALFDIKPSPHAILGEKNLPYPRKRGRGPSRQLRRAARAAPGIKPATQSHGVCDETRPSGGAERPTPPQGWFCRQKR